MIKRDYKKEEKKKEKNEIDKTRLRKEENGIDMWRENRKLKKNIEAWRMEN